MAQITRRSALSQGALAALCLPVVAAAGASLNASPAVTMPPIGNIPADHPDAALIRHCEQIVALRREQRLICIEDEWAPDYGPLHARYEETWREVHAAEEAIYNLDGPTTPAGALAVARAAVVEMDRTREGDPIANTLEKWLLVILAQHHAGDAFDAEVARLVRTENMGAEA